MPRRFGQHFIKHVPSEMLPPWEPDKHHHVLEIGPGKGAVTRAILKSFAKHQQEHKESKLTLTLIEVDPVMVQKLEPLIRVETTAAVDIQFHSLSVLDFNLFKFLLAIPPSQPLSIVSSLPYNLSKPIIKHIIDSYVQLNDQGSSTHRTILCRFIIQKEVGEAYAAKPPQGSFLGNWLQLHADEIQASHTLKPQEFSPPPAVDSIVLSFRLRKPSPPILEAKAIVDILRQAFAKPRKIITNTLKGNLASMTNSLALKRPSELTLDQWITLIPTPVDRDS